MAGYAAPIVGGVLGIGAEVARGIAFSAAAAASKKATEAAESYLFPRTNGNSINMPNRPAQAGVEMPKGDIASNYLPVISPESGINKVIVNRIHGGELYAPIGSYPNTLMVGGVPQSVPSIQPLRQHYGDVDDIIRNVDMITKSGIVGSGSRSNAVISDKQFQVDRLKMEGSVVRGKKKGKNSIFVTKKR